MFYSTVLSRAKSHCFSKETKKKKDSTEVTRKKKKKKKEETGPWVKLLKPQQSGWLEVRGAP